MDDIGDKTVLITGANSRIKFETAKQLAQGGAEIMVCRDATGALTEKAEIAKLAANRAPAPVIADPSSQARSSHWAPSAAAIRVSTYSSIMPSVFAKCELSVDQRVANIPAQPVPLDRLPPAPAAGIIIVASALHKAAADFLDNHQCKESCLMRAYEL